MNKTHIDVEGVVEYFRKQIQSVQRYSTIGQEDLLSDWLRTTLQSQADKYEREKEEMVREILNNINEIEVVPHVSASVIQHIGRKYGVDLSE